jgi:L-idonate 5-dehydrogenase
MAEPLSVVLHATHQAGDLLGKRVLITGCGPIGILSILTARRAGAAQIIATDLAEHALTIAKQCGADEVINVVDTPDALDQYSADKGYFDVLFECSGAPTALAGGIAALRPRGIIVQLGLGGDMSIPMMQLTAKELELRGSFRFHKEFATAVQMMQKGLIDVMPLATHSYALDDVADAFVMANDRSQAMKVQIAFTN